MQLLPPPEFIHPFKGTLLIERVPGFDVPQKCGGISTNACAFLAANGIECRIIIPADETSLNTAERIEHLLTHEIAHCNGWRHDGDGKE